MRVDKDDRYISEKANKDSTTSFKLPSFLNYCSKKKLIILGSAMVIFFLTLSFVILSSSTENEPTSLTSPDVNGYSSTNIENSNNAQSLTDELNASSNTQTTDSSLLPNSTTASRSNQSLDSQEPLTSNSNIVDESRKARNQSNDSTIKKPTTSSLSEKNGANSHNTISSHNGNRNNNNTIYIKDDEYTIQLSASSSIENLKKFVEKNNITHYQIYETKRNNSKWFILIKGIYKSSDEAKKAIKSLPSALQKDNPWVKSGASVNKEKAEK